MFIIFVGPPGVGKGTQCQRLATKLSLVHLSTGDILRAAIQQETELGATAKGFMDRGELVPDKVMVDLIGNRLNETDCQAGCILDGFPRTLAQAESLDEWLARHDRPIDIVLELTTDRAELRRRLLHRAALEGRPDDTPETIERRLEVYDQQTAPLVAYYEDQAVLRKIDGNGPPDDVFQGIVDTIKESQR